MRFIPALVSVIYFGIVDMAQADGLLLRLPVDGTWSRYSLVEFHGPDRAKKTFEGSLTLASVGTKKINGEKHRWIEIVIERRRPSDLRP